MERNKYHIIYKTVNIVNNKIYVGLHSTNNLNDSYLGSGWLLKAAIAKYGRANFKRTILLTLESRTLARELEALIVDTSFIARSDTYNLTVGGMGVEDQWGANNHQYGKEAPNTKQVRASHIDGRIIETTSIAKLVPLIGIARNNIRHLISSNKHGRRGWKVEQLVKI
jgi:hypothetical protein